MDLNTLKTSIAEVANKGLSKTTEFIEKIDHTYIHPEEEIHEPKKEVKEKDAYDGEDWFNDVGTIPQR